METSGNAHTVLNRHGLEMAVLVETPTGQPEGLCFVMHGMKGFKEQKHLAIMAKAALRNNFTTVRFDTTHSAGASQGDVSKTTITSAIEDLTDVVNWASNQSWYQAPFILAGHSMGGIAILEYASRHPQAVKAIAPIGACVSGQLSLDAATRHDPEAVKQWETQGFQRQDISARPGQFVDIPWSHMEDRLQYNSLLYAHNLKMPLFLSVGSHDIRCPPDHQEMLYAAWGGADKCMQVIPQAPHTYVDEAHLAIFSRSFDAWLNQQRQSANT